jgi:hypothetical protein
MRTTETAAQLRRQIAGEVIARGEPGWDAARRAWNLSAEQHPPLVVLADTTEDIAATVRFASAHGLRVAPQSTGHGAASMGDLAGTILLKTSRLRAVRVDPDARTATVQAGALWSDVVGPAAEHGLVGLHGFSGGVGVAGYTLGGGLGWLARRDGFASSHVRGFDVVGADGEARRVDASTDPDLFWALRGGGGRPVIVTSLDLELFELRAAFGGTLMWPIDHAEAVVAAYREWIAAIPVELTSTIKLLRFPSLPTVPDDLRGKAVVSVVLVFAGGETRGDELVAPLRAVAPTLGDTLAMVPGSALGMLAGDPTDPLPALGHAALVEQVDADATGAFLALAGPGVDSPLTSLEIRHLGGALCHAGPDTGAAGPLTAQGLVYAAGAAPTPEAGDRVRASLREVAERFASFSGERGTVLTFAEQPLMSGAFAPGVADRLDAITRAHDPAGLFVGNHVSG